MNNPSKIIFYAEIIEGQKIAKGQKFINSDDNIEFIISSVGHVNPPTSNYYPLIVNISSTNIAEYKNKIFVLE